MKTVSTIILGLLLSACLTLYGPFSVDRAGGRAVFSMEVCTDGVAKTVMFGADGNPVEPTENCPECLSCCQVIVSLVPESGSVVLSFDILEMEVDLLFVQTPILKKRHIFPAPRGPPVVQKTKLTTIRLILTEQSDLGQIIRSDGRLLFKDAFA